MAHLNPHHQDNEPNDEHDDREDDMNQQPEQRRHDMGAVCPDCGGFARAVIRMRQPSSGGLRAWDIAVSCPRCRGTGHL